MTATRDWYFVVDTTNPNALTAQTTAHKNENGVFVAHYTDGLTFDQYNAKNRGKFKLLSEPEYDEWLNGQFERICGNWEEISEESYWYLLECLPPQKWRDISNSLNVFAIMEAYTGNIHTFCLKDRKNNRYYKAMFPINADNERILNSFNEYQSNIYRYIGQCDKLRQTEEGEKNLQDMMDDPLESTREVFIKHCDIHPLIDEDETPESYLNHIDKEGAKYVWSMWGKNPCFYVEYGINVLVFVNFGHTSSN